MRLRFITVALSRLKQPVHATLRLRALFIRLSKIDNFLLSKHWALCIVKLIDSFFFISACCPAFIPVAPSAIDRRRYCSTRLISFPPTIHRIRAYLANTVSFFSGHHNTVSYQNEIFVDFIKSCYSVQNLFVRPLSVDRHLPFTKHRTSHTLVFLSSWRQSDAIHGCETMVIPLTHFESSSKPFTFPIDATASMIPCSYWNIWDYLQQNAMEILSDGIEAAEKLDQFHLADLV
jgi:hypothetical protein